VCFFTRLSAEGLDVNVRHPLGWTALHVAAVNGNVGAVRALLKAGADPNLGDEFISAHRTGIQMDLHAMDGNKYIINLKSKNSLCI